MNQKSWLDEIDDYCKAATPGPWEFERIYHDPDEFSYELNTRDVFIEIREGNYENINRMRAKFDSSFIGNARTHLPDLVTRLRRVITVLRNTAAMRPIVTQLISDQLKQVADELERRPG